jgi:antitoxin (DNA-binding transcriptional repressor) of toxin-antitoxin stability system
MRAAQVSELKDRWDEVIEALRNGEIVEIRDGDATLAEVVPANYAPLHDPAGSLTTQTSLKAQLDDLVRQGKARRGTDILPSDFFTRPLPEAKRSVLEALLEDRHSD